MEAEGKKRDCTEGGRVAGRDCPLFALRQSGNREGDAGHHPARGNAGRREEAGNREAVERGAWSVGAGGREQAPESRNAGMPEGGKGQEEG